MCSGSNCHIPGLLYVPFWWSWFDLSRISFVSSENFLCRSSLDLLSFDPSLWFMDGNLVRFVLQIEIKFLWQFFNFSGRMCFQIWKRHIIQGGGIKKYRGYPKSAWKKKLLNHALFLIIYHNIFLSFTIAELFWASSYSICSNFLSDQTHILGKHMTLKFFFCEQSWYLYNYYEYEKGWHSFVLTYILHTKCHPTYLVKMTWAQNWQSRIFFLKKKNPC